MVPGKPEAHYWRNNGRRMGQTQEQKKAFDRRLDKASYWEAYVSAVLARAGFWVLHAPIIQADSFDITTADLVVSNQEATWHQELEVKGCVEHSQENEVFVCSEASWVRKYGKVDSLPVPYVLVDSNGDIRFFPRGTQVQTALQYDKGRQELFAAKKAWIGYRRPLADLILWLNTRDKNGQAAT
jgi:hypothetical protein